jgi:hypothetical protein
MTEIPENCGFFGKTRESGTSIMGCGSSKNSSETAAVTVPSASSPSHLSPTPSNPALSSSSLPSSKTPTPKQQLSTLGSQETLTTQRIPNNDDLSPALTPLDPSNQENLSCNPVTHWTEDSPKNKDSTRVPDEKELTMPESMNSPETQGVTVDPLVSSEIDEPVPDPVLPLEEGQQRSGQQPLNLSLPLPDSSHSMTKVEVRVEESVTSLKEVEQHEELLQETAVPESPEVILIQRMWRGSLARHRLSRKASLEISSVLALQRFWKKCVQRKIDKLQAAQKLLRGVIRIQSWARKFLSQKFLKQLRQDALKKRVTSAVHTQRIWRSYRSRKLVRLMREDRLRERRELAAKRIQTRIRIRICQRIFQELQVTARQSLERTSALCLQRAFRCYHSRCQLAHLRQELLAAQRLRLLSSAALLIQRTWRGKVGRRTHQTLLLAHRQRLAACALLLQCAWRCHVSSRALDLLKRRHVAKRNLCATRIQSKARQRIAWRLATQLQRQKVASTRIQNAYRCHRSRYALRLLQAAALQRLLSAVLTTQMAWRVYEAKRRLQLLREMKRQVELERKSTVVLQCAWRCYVSRVSLQLLRLEDRERKGFASTKIQKRVRMRIAGRVLSELRLEAHLALQGRCAVLVQKTWRRWAQRNTLGLLREEHLLAQAILRETQRRERERAMALLIQRTFRGWRCREEVSYQRAVEWASPIVIKVMRRAPYVMRSYHPHVIELTLRSAKGINMSGRSSPNPYAIVGAFTDASKMKSSMLPLPALLTTLPFPPLGGGFLGTLKTKTMICYAKSKSQSNTTAPVWRPQDATLLISPASWNSRLVLTLMHAATFSKDSFLGQVSLDVRQYPQLYTGELVEIQDLPLGSYTFPVVDPDSREDLALRNCPNGKGTISFTLRLPLLSRSMCGWVWRASTYSLTKGQFKRRWMVLIDLTLSFYKDPFSLNECKGTIHCADVLDIVDAEDEEGAVVEVHYGGQQQGGKGHGGEGEESCWVLRWDRLSPPYTRVMWRQKLLKSCKHIRQKDSELELI